MTRPERTFITSAEVARLMEFDGAEMFLSRRVALERDHGFPTPVAFSRRPLKWRRSDVVAWLDGHYQPPEISAALPIGGDAARRVVMLHEARRA